MNDSGASGNMYFDESYFKGEEREGFYVKPMMKRVWAAQLEVLRQVDIICRRHNIEYFADWGTLLGAIRHGGYIPWDDDLDISMKRMDYMRFISVAAKELPEGYAIFSPSEFGDWKDWNQGLTRVLNSSSTPLQGECLRRYYGCPYATGLDIFPLDYLPLSDEEKELQLNMFQVIYMLGSNWYGWDASEEERMHHLREIEELCNIKFTADKPYMEQLVLLSDRVASMYWDMDEQAKELAQIWELVNKSRACLPVSSYQESVRVPFENTTIPVPIEYEKVLAAHYGENWRIPIRGAAGHDYPFYKKQQQRIIESYRKSGIEIPDYFLE